MATTSPQGNNGKRIRTPFASTTQTRQGKNGLQCTVPSSRRVKDHASHRTGRKDTGGVCHPRVQRLRPHKGIIAATVGTVIGRFACHGTGPQGTAKFQCTVCHQEAQSLRRHTPDTHRQRHWELHSQNTPSTARQRRPQEPYCCNVPQGTWCKRHRAKIVPSDKPLAVRTWRPQRSQKCRQHKPCSH